MTFETDAGFPDAGRGARRSPSTWERPGFAGMRSRWRRSSRHPHDRASDRPRRQSGSALAVGCQHRQSACDFLGRRHQDYDFARHGSLLGERSAFSRAGEYFARDASSERVVFAPGSAAPASPGPAAGRLRGGGRRGAPDVPSRGDGDAAGRRTAIRLARRDDHVLMTGPAELEYEEVRSRSLRHTGRDVER